MSKPGEPIEPAGDRPGAGLIISLLLSALIVILGFWYLVFMDRREEPIPSALLRQSCESSWGVLVEGVSETDGHTTRFSLCIPERAFECADLE